MAAFARRYLGFEIRDRTTEPRLLHRLKTASWVTFLDHTLVEVLGGPARARAEVAPSVEVIEVPTGLVFRTDELPPVGDVNRKAADLEHLRKLQLLLRPLILDGWAAPLNFGSAADDVNNWFARLDL